ncbi:MAG: FKBP-type peptidyl-prolyl cis-trans isomerase [Polyangiaceae bacterium]|nr:FKBP-type peptidyl-prolyl cis-trans isomerase [Polyangiaceae bacterium]MCK6534600.1 FKBP-type peptidyl-prolyl cis-trans isomerase [Polyangiaceae bacterium]
MPASSQYQVGPEIVVTLSYEVFDADGELVGGSDGPCSVVFGFGELLAQVERAVEGAVPGESRTVRLSAQQAFGERDPKAVIEFDRAEFPADVAPGDSFEAEGEGGDVVVLTVLDVTPDAVVVDQNHPLAGQPLRVEVQVLETRPATADELTAAAAELEEPADTADSQLIVAERLLRGPTQR